MQQSLTISKEDISEREALCSDVAGDVVLEFLPVADNLERAAQSAEAEEESNLLKME